MLDIERAEKSVDILLRPSEYGPLFADIKAALEATVMIELIKLLRAENAKGKE